MKFILSKQIKYYTKEIAKWINLVAIALFIVMTLIFIRYRLVCSVSISGNQIGYVSNKSLIENKLKEMLNLEGTNNIAFVNTIVPEYSFALISNNIELNEEQVISEIENETRFTYKFYAVTLDGEQKSIVNSLEDAEKLVAEINKKYKSKVKFTIGINELYTQNPDEYKTVNIKVAKKEVSSKLQKIQDASVNGIYLSQKPISGVITSRFGSLENIRSHAHTGLDIAAPYGTSIKAAAGGTVTTAEYSGSYGNLVVVNCGNGVEIYYGHCSKINVNVGDKVKVGNVIAEVGSTGNSTGPHLHFEIRVNGSQVNPQNYIYK